MKKILSIAIVCMMLITSVNVFAAGSAAMDLGANQTVTDLTATIVVPINITAFGFDVVEAEYDADEEAVLNPEEAIGVGGFQASLQYDSAVLTFTGFSKGTVKAPAKTATGVFKGFGDGLTQVGKEIVVDGTIKAVNAAFANKILEESIYKTGTIINANFTVVAGTTAQSTDLSLGVCKLSANDAMKTEYIAETKGMTISLPAPEPVVTETKVKTFEKRALVNGTDLVTVGIISKGTDYANVKAGLEVQKGEGAVKYWLNGAPVDSTTEANTAYYMIGLTGVDKAANKITAASGTRAIISVNGVVKETEEAFVTKNDAVNDAQ